MDVGTGLVLADSVTGLWVDARVRTLLVDQAERFRRAQRVDRGGRQPDAVNASQLQRTPWRQRQGHFQRSASQRRALLAVWWSTPKSRAIAATDTPLPRSSTACGAIA